MTIPTWALAVVLTPLFALLAYFVRTTTFDAIKELRRSAERQGKRIGRAEKALAVLLAREDSAVPRTRKNTLLELKAELEADDEDSSK